MAQLKQRRVDKAGARLTGGWYGKTFVDKDVWVAACERVAFLYREFDHVAVMFSAGKDSTSALMVTLEVATRLQKTPVRVIFGDEEVLTPHTVEYASRVAARPDVQFEWYCLPWKHRNACSMDSPFWYPWAPEDRALWVRDLPPEGLTELKGFPMKLEDRIPTTDWNALTVPYRKYGKAAIVMGIRAAESQVRRRSLANRAADPWIKECEGLSSAVKAYPIYDWSVADVWTATAKFEWDYNRTYEVFELLGLSRHTQRIAPPFGEEPRSQLWIWAAAYPELWAKMADRVPGVAAAARYARTEIYSYGAMPDLHGAKAWQDYIRMLIQRQPLDVQKGIAHVLQLWISRHYLRTPDPILDKIPHPETGLCWSDLAQLAEQGDFKKRQRIAPYAPAGSALREKQEVAYKEALKVWLANRA